MMNKIKSSIKIKGSLLAIIIVMFSCSAAFAAAFLAYWLLVKNGVVVYNSPMAIFIFALIALPLCAGLNGILLSLALSRIINPIIEISKCSQKVAKGDFTATVTHTGTDELGILAGNINAMVNELSKMEYLHKDFMSNVSHEFKTPLSAIKGYAELLCEDNLPIEERREYSQILAEETGRLNKLCSDLLRMARLDSGTVKMNVSQFYLDEQIRGVVVLLAEMWQNKHLEIRLDLDKVLLSSEEQLLRLVWLNLIENAIKYSDEGSDISISCNENGNQVKVKVNNHGSLISEESKSRIYEKFYQCDESHSQVGNGLGLSIAKGIIELLGGAINFESDELSGTTFIVLLLTP